jgi:hypothetical protein
VVSKDSVLGAVQAFTSGSLTKGLTASRKAQKDLRLELRKAAKQGEITAEEFEGLDKSVRRAGRAAREAQAGQAAVGLIDQMVGLLGEGVLTEEQKSVFAELQYQLALLELEAKRAELVAAGTVSDAVIGMIDDLLGRVREAGSELFNVGDAMAGAAQSARDIENRFSRIAEGRDRLKGFADTLRELAGGGAGGVRNPFADVVGQFGDLRDELGELRRQFRFQEPAFQTFLTQIGYTSEAILAAGGAFAFARQELDRLKAEGLAAVLDQLLDPIRSARDELRFGAMSIVPQGTQVAESRAALEAAAASALTDPSLLAQIPELKERYLEELTPEGDVISAPGLESRLDEQLLQQSDQHSEKLQVLRDLLEAQQQQAEEIAAMRVDLQNLGTKDAA